MSFLVAEAPAKVNLMLCVLDRAPDGYHRLDTVFQTIDLADTLEFRTADGIELSCDHPGVPADATNLVWRAAQTLRDAAGISGGVSIRLTKRIPPQGGLGGGSSDAAATLLACRRLWRLERPDFDLDGLARELGADVPFFLHGGTARGTRRGDQITPLASFEPRPLLLGIPPFGCPTGEVFSRASERLTLPSNSVSFPALFGHKWNWPNDLAYFTNDLESGVFERWPELGRFRDRLVAAGASRALLSGSGSSVFGIFEDDGTRDRAREGLSEEFESWSLVPTRTLDEGVRFRTG